MAIVRLATVWNGEHGMVSRTEASGEFPMPEIIWAANAERPPVGTSCKGKIKREHMSCSQEMPL
jgi:hypothetical protein